MLESIQHLYAVFQCALVAVAKIAFHTYHYSPSSGEMTLTISVMDNN